MATIASLLKQRIEALGYGDIKECARDYDLPYELLRKVISSGHIPKDKTLLLYAERLGMDAEELIRTAYRQKAPGGMEHLFSRHPVPKPGSDAASRMAPVLGKAACGAWLESYAVEPDQYEPVELRDPDAFFVVAEGESMIGGNIPPGAMLLVLPSAPVHNGQIVLARRGNEEFTVKTLYRKADGTTILQPMNPAFEPLLVEPGEPVTLMRVSEIRIKL
ncbi:MAG TPA: S24 family peptidase [bacterium]|nr:S24 family peptidase [bacterium]